MANKMLIDAAHPEETRVVVLRGSRVEEFDFEAASKKQLRGNIYLAKVTRVEPSLQAAFIDYGGNRHGFLAFSEIHPDYYQIPISDRLALIEAEAQEEPEEEEKRPPRRSRRHRRDRAAPAEARRVDETVTEAIPHEEAEAPQFEAHAGLDEQHHTDPTPDLIEETTDAHDRLDATDAPGDPAAPAHPDHVDVAAVDVAAVNPAALDADHPSAAAEAAPSPPEHETPSNPQGAAAEAEPSQSDETHEDHHAASDNHPHDEPDGSAEEHDDEHDEHEEDVSEHVEQLGGDAMEEIPVRAYRGRKQYKIQEVIKRRQVLLVQVVKEERGNKGAALTTYLSLAGRYSVLMPNTAKGGGISRKITDAGDRQRLKTIAQDLEVPEGMGVILRTAGASRTKPEVKRDFEYLMRMWETVRETTLNSQAPTLVYEEGSLIKRAIRDLYNKDVEEVIVAGEAAYREAKDFMRLLMPSHARNVQPWRDPQPIFAKAGAEAQLDAMFSSHVTLKSGGYLVINQTEALVAIDVNSGRSTREHNIEDTALRTNLEASDEVARQLRLRDLAGLIVVDFIDMEESRNNRAVEKRLKDALKNDRARIQVGRISHFGLLEMSRQRIRAGVLEGSTVVCEHCAGSGMVRSISSIALHVLRVLEDALISDASHDIIVRTRAVNALYVLNQKRQHLTDLEARFGVMVTFAADETLTGTTYCALERGERATGTPQPVRLASTYAIEPAVEDEEMDAEPQEEVGESLDAADHETHETGHDADGQRRKRRRRRRGRDRESSGIAEDAPQPADDALGFVAAIDVAQADMIIDADHGPAAEDHGEAGLADATKAEDLGRGEAGRDGPRRRRSRRGGRRPREGGEIQSDGAVSLEQDVEDEVGIAHTKDERALAKDERALAKDEEAPGFALEPVAANDVIPDLAQGPAPIPTALTTPEIVTTPEPVVLVEPEPEEEIAAATPLAATPPLEPAAPPSRKPDLVSSELDPAQPKRSGWWQRAKATLGG